MIWNPGAIDGLSPSTLDDCILQIHCGGLKFLNIRIARCMAVKSPLAGQRGESEHVFFRMPSGRQIRKRGRHLTDSAWRRERYFLQHTPFWSHYTDACVG